MSVSRSTPRVERITLTLVPVAEEHSYDNVPTTFSQTHRSYEWRKSAHLRYMIVPKKVSSKEVLVDFFFELHGKESVKDAMKNVQQFVEHKVVSDWKGLKLESLGKPTASLPPQKAFVRGTIEEMLGTKLIR
jgi:hypothetical protein